MADRKRIALLVAQADEYYQSRFIEGFIGRAFEKDCDVLVFSSYLKYQNNMGREVGETSIFTLVPFETFDAIAVILIDDVHKRYLARVILLFMQS